MIAQSALADYHGLLGRLAAIQRAQTSSTTAISSGARAGLRTWSTSSPALTGTILCSEQREAGTGEKMQLMSAVEVEDEADVLRLPEAPEARHDLPEELAGRVGVADLPGH